MDTRKVIGIVMIVLSIALFMIVGSQITTYVSLTGLSLGAQAEYTPPFPYHGPLIVAGGVCAFALLLLGLYLLSSHRQ